MSSSPKEQPVEEGKKTGDAAASSDITLSLWNTIESPELQQHPLLQVAFLLYKENLDSCLSKSYREVDTEGALDHRQVILTLPGRFGIGDDMGPEVYGVTRPHTGIVFNKALVDYSTEYVFMRGQDAINALHEDMNVLTYIALLQETLEHELGHWKFHCEGVKSPNGTNPDYGLAKITPKRLRYEAGYAVQQRIREDNFDESAESIDCKIIDLSDHFPDNSHLRAPLQPVFEYLSESPKHRLDQFELRGDETDSDESHSEEEAGPLILTKAELLKHMEYPSKKSFCDKKRKRDDAGDSFGPDPYDGSEGGGFGKPPPEPPSSDRSCGPWIESVRSFLPAAVRQAHQIKAKSNSKKRSRTNETDTEGNDHLLSRPKKNSLYKPSEWLRCRFQVSFCDENRNSKTNFAPNDLVYVRLRVTNPTQDCISVGINGGRTLGVSSFELRIDGSKPGRMDCGRPLWKTLGPSQSFTFFRLFTKPVRDHSVPYSTPLPGHHTAAVWVSDEMMEGSQASFRVDSQQEETSTRWSVATPPSKPQSMDANSPSVLVPP